MRYVAGQKEQQWIYRWSLALPTGGSSLINTRAIREESGPISFTDEILAHCDTVQSFFGPSFPASSTREFKVSVSFPAVISERRLTFPNEPGPTHFPCEPRSFQVAVKRREERERAMFAALGWRTQRSMSPKWVSVSSFSFYSKTLRVIEKERERNRTVWTSVTVRVAHVTCQQLCTDAVKESIRWSQQKSVMIPYVFQADGQVAWDCTLWCCCARSEHIFLVFPLQLYYCTTHSSGDQCERRLG